VQVTTASLGTSAQIEALLAGACDVGFTVQAGPARGLSIESVTDEPLLVILPARHRFARRRSVRLSELESEAVILMSRAAEPAIHAIYERMCAESAAPPAIAFEVDHADTMFSFVAAGLGISYAPAAIRALAPAGVACLPLAPRVPAGIAAMWDPRAASPVVERFLTLLRDRRGRRAAAS
jgi:DNA-binding transcriptional LysR family regulator